MNKPMLLLALFVYLASTSFVRLPDEPKLSLDLLNGKTGVYKTYQDFLKGNIMEGEFLKTTEGFSVTYKINGKKMGFGPKDAWGYRATDGLYRFDQVNNSSGPVVVAGDIIYYGNWATEVKVKNNKYSITLMDGPGWPCWVSKDLGSPMVPFPPSNDFSYKKHYQKYQEFRARYKDKLPALFDCLGEQPVISLVFDCTMEQSNVKFRLMKEDTGPKGPYRASYIVEPGK